MSNSQSPLSNLDFYHTGSASTTPESEIESSLAYKGTERYGGKARQSRKLEKTHELAKTKVNEEGNVADNYCTLDTEETYSENSEAVDNNCNGKTETRNYEQTNYEQGNYEQTNISPRSPSRKSKKATRIVKVRYAISESHDAESDIKDSKVQQTYTVESRGVQTDLVWSTVEAVEDLFANIDQIGMDGMKELFDLKNELIKRKQDIPEVKFEELVSEESLSDEILSDSSTEDGNERMETTTPGVIRDDGLLHTYGGSMLSTIINSRRISSAHCIGQRKDTLPEEGNIVDQFRARGEEVINVDPEILQFVGEKSMRTPDIEHEASENSYIKGWYDGLCQFCGQKLLKIPTRAQIEDPVMSPYIEYCCTELKYFIKLLIMNEETESVTDELIDVNPNAGLGPKNNKKNARDRLADRLRERDMEKQKAAAQQANFFAFAKQMKTIQYSLASSKCMDDGWTIKPLSPLPPEPISEENQFEVEVNSTLLQTAGVLVDKFYENGNPFLTIFPDGTGCCYYPSGNVAVIISSTEKGKFTYIVQTNQCYDDLEDSGLLAIFEPNGNSVCYYKNGRIRTFINANGGIELDQKGQRKKRWQWYFIKGHVHTPPFYPLCFSLNRYLSVRVLDQHNIALIFASSKRSVRFNVSAQLKFTTPGRGGYFKADESEKYLIVKKKRINTILNNLHSALRLPKSTREGKFSTPSQRKKEQLERMFPHGRLALTQLPPIDAKQAVII